MFQFPAFGYQLEYQDGVQSPSRILQVINLLTGFFSIAMILSSRSGPAAVKRCWPILVLVALPFASAAWSSNPVGTIRASVTFLISTLFGLAIAIRMPGYGCVRFVIRIMALGCFLSVVWVFLLPQIGVHQLNDMSQNAHVGLWRGIFTHKQHLGTFAGLTFGLLAFYGSWVFRGLVVRVGAIACAIACVLGSQSATGLGLTILMTGSLFTIYWIARRPPATRRNACRILVIAFAFALVAFYYNLLSFVPELFGKSSDLTGRSESWWLLRNGFENSGKVILGSGRANTELIFTSPDNAYLVMLIEFGYLGFTVIFSVLGWTFLKAVGLVQRSPASVAALRVFAPSVMIVLAFYFITETGLMEKNIVTILLTIAVQLVVQERYRSALAAQGRRSAYVPAGVEVAGTRSLGRR